MTFNLYQLQYSAPSALDRIGGNMPGIHALLERHGAGPILILIVIWIVAAIVLCMLPPLVAKLTGQEDALPVYFRYSLTLTLVAMTFIGAPIAIFGFSLLIICAAFPSIGKALVGQDGE